jgi:hypothetical protein
MRAILSGIAAAVVFGIIAAVVLFAVQEPAYRAYSTTSTRVGDPGTNLVGKGWTGDPRARPDKT